MTTTPKPSSILRFQPEIEAELKRSIADSKSPLFRMLRYHLGWADQMGMPERHAAQERSLGTLTLLSAEATGGDTKRVTAAAAAIELTRAYFQIHEQLRAGTPEVNGRAALWWHAGASQGINAGDGMYALARLTLMQMEEQGMPATSIVGALGMLDKACLRITESLFAEISAEGTLQQTPEAYLEVLKGKAALHGCACAVGASLAHAQPKTIDALREFGELVGAAALIREEVDALWGVHGSAKSQLIEMLDKRRSLPILAAFKMATGKEKAALEATIVRDEPLSDERLSAVLRIMESVGGKRFCEEAIGERIHASNAALKWAGLPTAGAIALEEIVRHMAGA